MTRADSLSCSFVDLNSFNLTKESMLKDLSPPATDTEINTKISKAIHTWVKLLSTPLLYIAFSN